MREKICIGLTGRMGSGKGEVARILQRRGYRYISLSDIVYREAGKTAEPINRAQMQDIGNRLRQKGGPGILGKEVAAIIRRSSVSHWVIDGIRNPAEVAELKKLNRFLLFGIETEIPIILQRLQHRDRNTDRISTQELLSGLEREWGDGEPAEGQQVGACMQLHDFLVQNNSSLEELEKKVEEILNTIGGRHE